MSLRLTISIPTQFPHNPNLNPHQFFISYHENPQIRFTKRVNLQITHTQKKSNKYNDSELSSELLGQITKINSQLEEREIAMEKSKQLLFNELCTFLKMKSEEVMKQWRKMSEDEKMGLVNGFVSDWSLDFHPISGRSVKEMVEEYVNVNVGRDGGGGGGGSDPDSGTVLPGVKRFFGL